MQLDELFNYKNQLMKTLCSNAKIVKLVTDDSDAPVPNYNLAYSQIFPYEHLPNTVDNATTFICFDVDVLKVVNKTFYRPAIYVWTFAHKSKMRLDEGGIRIDQLAVEINKELNGSRYFGLGELDLYSVGRFVPIADYQGRELTYTADDFNRQYHPSRPPSNRKPQLGK